ncbi:MAG TPA: type II toxin-antitoxin system RelE/ParE family toxin [Ignavibacteria bacterium]|nr:type II toxin-antitoxin system RelE/ParE family toxin [Ignavibacteria bacterium]
MKIIETQIFTKRITSLLTHEDYRNFQNELIINPEKGNIIRGSGGLRKIRWSIEGKGKSGGVRIIYCWLKEREIILLLFVYKKNEYEDLTNQQIKLLKSIVEKELK